MSTPARVSKGVPTGGQFAASARSESGITLAGARTEPTWKPGDPIDYADPDCICAADGMGRRTECRVHGAAASLRAQAAKETEAAAKPRHAWSTDADKVAPPKGAVALVADAEDAGLDVTVIHDSHRVSVTLERPGATRTNLTAVWSAGEFHDEPNRGPLPFRTTAGTPGVRFDYGEGFVGGEWVSVRSASQARLYMGLHEKPTKRD